MKKIIWTCWFQGRNEAPNLVRKCFESWERNNPNWEFRCLDAHSVERYLSVRDYIDLDQQMITAASLSDIVRILLLREFGGVWADSSLFCNRPLDDWLPEVMNEGFFAFNQPAPDRPLASWFLSSEPDNTLVAKWCHQTLQYWKGRPRSDDYFWFHHIFRDLCETDQSAARAWDRVPKVSADGPHSIQHIGMYRAARELVSEVDWSTPVFKLTYRIDEKKSNPGCLLQYLFEDKLHETKPTALMPEINEEPPMKFASLKVSTDNLGDHIQIIAGLNLLNRLGVKPTAFIDRDEEIGSESSFASQNGRTGILMNGWFKRNGNEWPPHPQLLPLFLGFHIRLFQCPELLSKASLDYFRRQQPIGCRDVYTEKLLQSKGVDAFTSNCLSLIFPRRQEYPSSQTETYVVSRDDRLLKHLPSSLGPFTFLSHYTGAVDFEDNMAQAYKLLEEYRNRAKLIVTTMLHCALPAMAMGIPVIVFYPLNNEAGHLSDRERFSSLEQLVRVYRVEEMDDVDWCPGPVDVSDIKLSIFDRFYEMAARWRIAQPRKLEPIADSDILPVP